MLLHSALGLGEGGVFFVVPLAQVDAEVLLHEELPCGHPSPIGHALAGALAVVAVDDGYGCVVVEVFRRDVRFRPEGVDPGCESLSSRWTKGARMSSA
jgi:hypothetical protein